jgi:integrase/recombinase XerC
MADTKEGSELVNDIEAISPKPAESALAVTDDRQLALRTATGLWSEATTAATTQRRDEVIHDKVAAVRDFFDFTGKSPAEVAPADVQAWRVHLESQRSKEGEQLQPATVYARVSRLSSFYTWLMSDPQLAGEINSNPVLLARPKAPRAYQSESTKALPDEKIQPLAAVIKARADKGSVTAKRDYALFLFYMVTGLRRSEIIGLRGTDIEEDEGGVLVLRGKVKGGDYVERELRDTEAQGALKEYLRAARRLSALGTKAPVWTRHDRAGKPGAPLSSHAFAHNLKLYAAEAGIRKIHVHQLRHTFGRMVAEETGSLDEVQEALGHRNRSTTRVYVQRITRKRDKHSRRISERILKTA